MSVAFKAVVSRPLRTYSVHDIKADLSLSRAETVTDFILSSSFLELWTTFRDLVPLKPNVPVDFGPEDREALVEFSTQIYNMMDSMSMSVYDRPTISSRGSWTIQEHFQCLIYQASRELACLGQPFASVFDRHNLKNKTGQAKAMRRINGLVMLSINLMAHYTSTKPPLYIEQIEEARPAKNPEWSPILKVRFRHQLNNMDTNDLRKKALETELEGKDEKEWLINMIMEKQGMLPKGAGSGAEVKAAETSGLKRTGETLENDGEKRARAE